MDLVAKLNDRNLSFPDRCCIAASLLKPSASDTWLFPRKNQYLFDWFTGTLLKLAKTDSPKPEIFLNKSVWELMKEFSMILVGGGGGNFSDEMGSGKLKRSVNFITNDEEFFDFKKCFDSQVFVIKCPLLTIFQTSLSLLEKSNKESDVDAGASADAEVICSVILRFLQQTRVSLPVSFSQVTEFVRSLVKCKKGHVFNQVLRPTLIILSEIILGGGANYKKTYPLLVKFCIESASFEEEIWIEFMKKCLFFEEFHEELLTFLTSPLMINSLKIKEDNNEILLNLPKSVTFQKALFIELATNAKAVESCPVIYESFLRSVGSKINRETGFNFFTFLLRKTLPNNPKLYSIQLSKLLSVLNERGNEIYQQRNDEIYRNQSAVIEEIFNYSMKGEEAEESVSPQSSPQSSSSPASPEKSPSQAFPLLLSLARLNYYLVAERLNLILLDNDNDRDYDCKCDFIVGMFELAALANQLPVLLETIILKSKLSTVLKSEKVQISLIRIFNFNLSPISLHEIYLSLIKNLDSEISQVLLVPVLRSIGKVVDNVESFDLEIYSNLQKKLIEINSSNSLNLLSEIVRWSPGTFLLVDDIFTCKFSDLNLILTIKCKSDRCANGRGDSDSYAYPYTFDLVLKYLPIVANDLDIKKLEEFCFWLLRNDQNTCISTLKMIKFYEIKTIRQPFLEQLIKYIKETDDESFVSEIISLIPWEYLNDEMAVELIKSLWFSPSAITKLLKLPSPFNVRKGTLKILISTNLTELVEFLFSCESDDLVSKCFDFEHSVEFLRTVLKKLSKYENFEFKINFVAKILKFSDFQSSELISFIETEIKPVEIIKTKNLTIEILDSFDTILEWIVDYKMELVAASILALVNPESLEIAVRCQALKCKFPARTDFDFINESVNLASKLPDSAVITTFKKDLLSLIKELPCDQVKTLLESFISLDSWKFTLGLQAFNQFLHITAHCPTIFTLFNDNLEKIYMKSLEFNVIPSFLAVLKSIIQLKKTVTWEPRGISNILGVLRRARQAQPNCYEEIFTSLRLIVTLHLRQFKTLLPLLVSNICEAFSGVTSLEESAALGRILSELGSLRRGELEPFALLPILHTFISTKFSSPAFRKPLQLAMTNLMYHLGTKKQLLQLLSTALVVEHEHRVILKSFIDEYNKFHKYSGRS